MSTIMKSKTMVYNYYKKEYTPKWKFDVDNVRVYLFLERRDIYREVAIINKYCRDHIRYLKNHYPERIQELLDNGKIYLYIRRKEKAAWAAVDSQLEKWLATDKEYRIAKEKGDFLTEVGLYNNLKARAEEIMYPSIIYV